MQNNSLIKYLILPFFKIKNFMQKKMRKKTVSVIYLHGVIGAVSRYSGQGSLDLKSIKSNIDRAFDNKNNIAVALSINSPGGSPVQSELIQKYISLKAKKSNIPVLAFVEDIAASGGYWLACSGEKIYASENSIIGSIGVISAGFGFVDAIKKLGIERRIITQGENKSIYDPFMPTRQKDVKIIESLQEDIHQSFKELVKKSRGKKINADNKFLFSGEFWTGKKALDLGLIDEINDMYTVLERDFGKEIKIQCISAPKSFLKKLFGLSSANDIAANFMNKVKQDSFWERYGL